MADRSGFDGSSYQARFDALAAQGMDVHGEADLVRSLGASSVLDAGCGTGRVTIELARSGIDVVGVDRDPSMLAEALRRGPQLAWLQADLCDLRLGRSFDVVLLAGNVPLFALAGTQSALVASCATHVVPGGAMLAGFSLGEGYGIEDYDAACAASGLSLEQRWATWDRQPFDSTCRYAVSLHRSVA